MAERKSTFLSMVLTLFLVTFLSASILGFVHDLTKEAIEAANVKIQSDAIKSILPEFDELGKSYKIIPTTGGDSLEFFPAYKADKLVGTAVKTWTKNGFSGLILVMAGFDIDGTVTGYQILEHKETPGLGSKMDTWFSDTDEPKHSIIGKNPEKVKFTVTKDGGEIDAITASTITSRAFLEAVRRAYETYKQSDIDGATSQTEHR